MTEVFLDGFNIIARFKGSHGKRMTEIMKSSGIQTNFFDSVLEPFIYIDMRQMPTYFVRENEIPFVVPRGAGFPFHILLSFFLLF